MLRRHVNNSFAEERSTIRTRPLNRETRLIPNSLYSRLIRVLNNNRGNRRSVFLIRINRKSGNVRIDRPLFRRRLLIHTITISSGHLPRNIKRLVARNAIFLGGTRVRAKNRRCLNRVRNSTTPPRRRSLTDILTRSTRTFG